MVAAVMVVMVVLFDGSGTGKVVVAAAVGQQQKQ